MRVLLLGASGYLGRFVADRLLADPAVQLTALGRSDEADVRFDLSTGSPGALTRFLDAVHPGVVVNCAGTTRGNGRELIRHNVVATAAVCESLRRSGCGARLVHVGCAAEYGPSQVGSSTGEDAIPRPGGPYGVSKLAGTELVLASGLDAVVLRVFSPIGPGTPAGTPLGRVAEAMRRAMQQGDSELKLGGLGVQRDFVDVRDVARAVHAASLSAAQGIVNIGTGRAVRLRDAASLLARVAGYAGAVHEQGGGPGGQGAADSHPVGLMGGPGGPSGPGGHAASGGHGGHGGPAGGLGSHGPVIPAQSHGSQHVAAHHAHPPQPQQPASYPYPDGCGAWQQADVRTARDRLGWRPRIGLEESLADIWMEAACRI
ncbi:NAD-dependent epimerase/dehydratase family protein [Streptomyces sp. 891-h]|uniref:NAD-dependent epimerase/dehydratase family protein n=1 Tax=Streptomyces sp. 891-h TaxID=2720714 RepID=UPI001FAAA7AE|nr:NAD-dependent epimerase/dehydratase family protein [Streptomyces sp. 891-h]UNZ17437.1 NAD-dependent epimerase/dehydratase family protein [Streptomyces sp. 891-h]